tara:strand:+ start:1845 stop:2318 length:474 start_codon:yes stop_codon:yes gene_type:complete
MIIECINCNKVFEVNSELIPENGRTIQCGSCNHVWFYNPRIVDVKKEKVLDADINISKKSSIDTPKNNKLNFFKGKDFADLENKKNYEITQYKPKRSLSFSNLLSYLVVLLISFVALLVLIDTFSSFLYQLFPNLEIIIFNLFETLKDIELFIKDLI